MGLSKSLALPGRHTVGQILGSYRQLEHTEMVVPEGIRIEYQEYLVQVTTEDF